MIEALRIEAEGLAARGINRGLVLALVVPESDVRFPLPLEVTLFGGDALGGAEDRISTAANGAAVRCVWVGGSIGWSVKSIPGTVL